MGNGTPMRGQRRPVRRDGLEFVGGAAPRRFIFDGRRDSARLAPAQSQVSPEKQHVVPTQETPRSKATTVPSQSHSQSEIQEFDELLMGPLLLDNGPKLKKTYKKPEEEKGKKKHKKGRSIALGDEAATTDTAVASKSTAARFRQLLSYLVFVIAAGVLVWSVQFAMAMRPAITSEIAKKAGYPVYGLKNSSRFKIDRSSVELTSKGNIVYFIDDTQQNRRFVVSQQATPDVIKDDAQYEQFLLDTDRFASFDAPIGKAYFTRPSNIGSDISIVIRNESTLMFVRGPGSISEQDWTLLLSKLQPVK